MTAAELFQAALRHYQAGKNDSAAPLLRQSLKIDPNYFPANYLLGLIELQAKRLGESVKYLEKAAALQPDSPDAQNNLGTALRSLGRFDEAEAAIRNSLRLRSDYPIAHLNLGVVLRAKGQNAEAIASYRAALRLQPDFFEALMNLGNVQKDSGEVDAAKESFRLAVGLRPRSAEAQCGLGNVLQTMGDLEGAVICYQIALSHHPNHCNALVNLGIALKRQAKFESAIDALERAVAADSRSAEAHEHLAGAMWEAARMDEAMRHYQKALEIQPSARLRIIFATLIPLIYSSAADLKFWRERLVMEVARLKAEGVRHDITHLAPRTLFYLPYQGFDDQDIQRDVASLYTVAPSPPISSGRTERMRVGFISALFKDHTIGLWMQGLIARLARQDFHVIVLSAGVHTDATNALIRQHADQYVELPTNLSIARKVIADLKLDVLLYTDLGMEPFTNALAFSRLARVQCVTWGHPLTSGIPTIDYFISSEMVEPPNAERYYTEKLIKLPHWPLYYIRPKPPSVMRDRTFFNLPADAHVYGCLHSVFKIHPDFDMAIAGILRGDPKGLFILPQGPLPGWDEILKHRFGAAMADVADRIRFIPRLSRDEFRSLTAVCDVTLAPFPFGAGDTSLEAFALCVPVVTLAAAQLKGRFTYAMYRMMEMTECVATTAEQYVTISLRLGADKSFNNAVRRTISERNGILFENRAGVSDLEEFLKSLK